MGVASSTSTSTLAENVTLLRLVGTQPVLVDDPLWDDLVQFQLVLPRVCGKNGQIFENEVKNLCMKFAQNCLESGNFRSLVELLGKYVRHISTSEQLVGVVSEGGGLNTTMSSASKQSKISNANGKATKQLQTKENERHVWYLHNVLLILRVFCKYVLDNEEEDLVEQIFECRSVVEYNSDSKTPSAGCSKNNGTLAVYLLQLWAIIVDVEVTGLTFGIVLEATTSLLVLLSHRLYHILADKHDCVSQHVLINTSVGMGGSKEVSSGLPAASSLRAGSVTSCILTKGTERRDSECNSTEFHGVDVYDITHALLNNFMENKSAPERPRSFLSSLWSGGSTNSAVNGDSSGQNTYDVDATLTFPFLIQESSESTVSLSKENLLLLLTLNCHRGSAESVMGVRAAVVNEDIPVDESTIASIEDQCVYARTRRISSKIDMSLLEEFKLMRKYKFPHAIATMKNNETAIAITESFATNMNWRHKAVSFARLYRSLCGRVGEEEEVAILLYILLSDNIEFRAFILSRTDLENLTIPLLKVLLSESTAIEGSNPERAYVVLCILLIISQDASYNAFVHDTVVADISWFKEKSLTDVPLGSIIVLILVRVMQDNLVKEKDAYLQTVSLAILANMSSGFKNLHVFAAQRVIRLFDILTRKFQKIDGFHRLSALEADFLNTQDEEGLQIESSLESDVLIYADFLRIMLEIIGSTFTANLSTNPHLIYNLLQKRDILDKFHVSNHFLDILVNIEALLDYFQAKIEVLPHNSITNYDTVFQCIIDSAKGFSNKLLEPLPQLSFQQAEDCTTSDFFQTYVWSLVVRSAPVFWDRSRIVFYDALKMQPFSGAK
ncbi:hypothetical protein SARC_02490 [Sphaeroforma arctica JP610]|uniref:Dymeclin n=1 Tax=Sphaeroforma arctica JP610 TaxID=667725 RepID=A0A0L0G8E2_9EUKA|nr:hypothetical protein SARC_02490 [Sphaeroforma arctica JP610]KNC85307.1 hypothetical protein SARC_02490 [Sphaeroforma arctica JP610]|eukprot:XP_014159209.1 hypothetical protein SARC_02490 [Sphaeroforma arctica JP610]